jgi:hypothetical protein
MDARGGSFGGAKSQVIGKARKNPTEPKSARWAAAGLVDAELS